VKRNGYLENGKRMTKGRKIAQFQTIDSYLIFFMVAWKFETLEDLYDFAIRKHFFSTQIFIILKN